jgi:exo-beta-1,3-glucanase (GH17 family)
MAYSTPESANYPTCGDIPADIVKDIQLISQLTTRIRLYGADCNQSALVIDAIQRTKTNLTVFLGIYISTDTTVFPRQLSETLAVLQQYGADQVAGITVGNEYILDQYTVSPSLQSSAQTTVLNSVASVRQSIAALKLPKTIPIGTSDAGSMLSTALGQGCDYVMANDHPFFSGITIDQAAVWAWEYIETNTPALVNQATNHPTLYQGEVGWPSTAIPGGSLSLNGSIASIPDAQEFLDTWVCPSNANKTQYFYFEAFDEAWKIIYNGSEPFWGIFDDNRVLKNLTIPNCVIDY